MALVEYSDSDSPDEAPPTKKVHAENQIQRTSNTQSSLPPLPAEFRDLYSVSARVGTQDDPTLHDGRKRANPHVVGNWPTHIYLEWYPEKSELAILSDVISQSQDCKVQDAIEIHSLLYSNLGAQLPLHISLSRPVVLVTEERQSFCDLFKNSIHSSGIGPFDLIVKGLDWVSNFENTRWFLMLRINKPTNNALNGLLRISNHTLSIFGQPPLYKQPAPVQQTTKKRPKLQSSGPIPQPQEDFSEYFHISIAWTLTKPSLEDINRVKSLDITSLQEMAVHFDSVKVKIGNQIHNVELPMSAVERSGLPGL